MYKNLKEIYDERPKDIFSMAMAHIVDKWFNNIKGISDEEINKYEGNLYMTAEFVQELVKLAREIVRTADNPTEIIQFCQAVDLFDRNFYCDKTDYDKLETITYNAVSIIREQCSPEYDEYYSWNELCVELGCEPEDLLSIGVIDEKVLEDIYSEMEE